MPTTPLLPVSSSSHHQSSNSVAGGLPNFATNATSGMSDSSSHSHNEAQHADGPPLKKVKNESNSESFMGDRQAVVAQL